MWLYWHDYGRLCSLDQLIAAGAKLSVLFYSVIFFYDEKHIIGRAHFWYFVGHIWSGTPCTYIHYIYIYIVVNRWGENDKIFLANILVDFRPPTPSHYSVKRYTPPPLAEESRGGFFECQTGGKWEGSKKEVDWKWLTV